MGDKGSFLAICNFFVFFPLFQIWSKEFFSSTGIRKGTNMFSGPANLSKCHLRKRDKSYSKDPYFLCRKTSRNGIELRQDRYLSMRSVSNHECSFYLTCLFRTCKIIERRRALVFYSCSVKGNKYIPLSKLPQGIFASIIEMLLYGRYNSYRACHSGSR